jgi:hypothetical protein
MDRGAEDILWYGRDTAVCSLSIPAQGERLDFREKNGIFRTL